MRPVRRGGRARSPPGPPRRESVVRLVYRLQLLLRLLLEARVVGETVRVPDLGEVAVRLLQRPAVGARGDAEQLVVFIQLVVHGVLPQDRIRASWETLSNRSSNSSTSGRGTPR